MSNVRLLSSAAAMTIPENITRLHDGEEKLREESLRRIEERSDTSAHLVMIEQSMNLFHALLPTMEEHDTDQLTLGISVTTALSPLRPFCNWTSLGFISRNR